MSKTRDDLIRQVLANLGVLSDVAPGNVEYERVDRVIDPVVSDLNDRDICDVGDVGTYGNPAGNIDDGMFLDFCQIVSFEAAPAFGMAMNETLAALAARAESRLVTKAAPSRATKQLSLDPAFYTARRGTYRF